jgi:hypothetical protein
MRSAILYRLAIPLLLTLVSGSIFFRSMILVVLAVIFSSLLLSRLSRNVTTKTGKTTNNDKDVIDGNYKIMDDNE